ncbi:MarR family winged helix-turn-helix transcriptional regulator [Paraburkholderia unamae]|uniref:MarR family winged helix-turn-helix transcriptional regulator n=1 Tax=Paraburkholderia unamae TaxID=219649 RepID=UPI000E30AF56|nr:MarR family transcriptional regulator [Paraburkholderia unamae]
MTKKDPQIKHGQYALPPEWTERYHRMYPDLPPEIFDAIYALRRTAQRVDNAFSAWLSNTDLTPAKMGLLMLVWAAGDEPVSFSQLGNQLSVTRATISGLVDGLVKDDFVMRVEDLVDRRNLRVKLSPQGRKRLKRVMDDHCRRLTFAFGSMDSTELTTMAQLLNQLADRAEAISDSTPL